jgi:tRNA(Arg) A34 adenosine deaminase TadA
MHAARERDADAWDQLPEPWRVAFDEAWAAWCAGSLPIGAAVADARGRVIARGGNGIFSASAAGIQRAPGGHILAHAELVALFQMDYRSVDLRGCVLYTTLEPCPLCVGAIRMMPIREVQYAAHDAAGGSVALLDATEFMRWVPVRAVHAADPFLEALSLVLNVAAHLRRTDGRAQRAFQRWEEHFPRSVQLGRRLSEHGVLEELRARGATAAEMVRALANDWITGEREETGRG